MSFVATCSVRAKGGPLDGAVLDSDAVLAHSRVWRPLQADDGSRLLYVKAGGCRDAVFRGVVQGDAGVPDGMGCVYCGDTCVVETTLGLRECFDCAEPVFGDPVDDGPSFARVHERGEF